jgi:hypothetical protein
MGTTTAARFAICGVTEAVGPPGLLPERRRLQWRCPYPVACEKRSGAGDGLRTHSLTKVQPFDSSSKRCHWRRWCKGLTLIVTLTHARRVTRPIRHRDPVLRSPHHLRGGRPLAVGPDARAKRAGHRAGSCGGGGLPGHLTGLLHECSRRPLCSDGRHPHDDLRPLLD